MFFISEIIEGQKVKIGCFRNFFDREIAYALNKNKHKNPLVKGL